MIKVIIADDQELIRQSFSTILSVKENIEVLDLCADGEEVLKSVEKNTPDVILMDVRMPGMNGLTCTKIIKEKYPQIKIIVLTTFDDDEYIYYALRYGASSYLLKGVSLDELYHAIETVYAGGGIIHPDVAIKAMKMFSEMANISGGSGLEEIEDIPDLSNNEWRIVEQVSKGLSNKEIAKVLSFSEGTVRNYISSVLDKLYLRDRTQLAIWGVQNQHMIEKKVKE